MNDTEFRMRSEFAPPSADTTASHVVASHAARVLLAEDDSISCRFLADGLRQMAVQVVACADGRAALERGRIEAFDLLLLDCHLPGAGALAVLAALRTDPRAASRASVAVATSAAFAPGERDALLAAGFSGILPKPCTLAQLRQLLALIPAPRTTRVLDDGAGLRSSGDPATLRALRQLLHAELTDLGQHLDVLWHDRAALDERLHRLQASCGFCGAGRLSAAAATLQHAVRQHDPDAAALSSFRSVLAATSQALQV